MLLKQVCPSVCECAYACVSEHNVPSIHRSLLAKPGGVRQSKSPSRTRKLPFLDKNSKFLSRSDRKNMTPKVGENKQKWRHDSLPSSVISGDKRLSCLYHSYFCFVFKNKQKCDAQRRKRVQIRWHGGFMHQNQHNEAKITSTDAHSVSVHSVSHPANSYLNM